MQLEVKKEEVELLMVGVQELKLGLVDSQPRAELYVKLRDAYLKDQEKKAEKPQ